MMTTIMEKRREAVELNNHGVRFFEAAQYEKAMDCFLEALQLFTHELQLSGTSLYASDKVAEIRCSSREIDNSKWFTTCTSTTNNDGSKGTAPMTSSLDSLQGNHMYIYTRTLSLSTNLENSNLPTLIALLLESTAVVFNLALTHHIIGLATNQSTLLEKAIHLYNITAMIRSKQLECQADLIDLALLNNIGHIYFEFSDYASASVCFDRLSQGMLYLKDYGLLEALMIPPRDKQGLILNTMISLPTLAAAA